MWKQVADGAWVRQSEWVWSNAVVVRGDGGLILVDPGIDGSDLEQLADEVDRLGIPVVAGFSPHPHWDYLLWHARFGEVPRYATAGGARASPSSWSACSPRCPGTGGPCPDAHSIAAVVVCAPGLRMVLGDGDLEALQMLADGRDELSRQRCRR